MHTKHFRRSKNTKIKYIVFTSLIIFVLLLGSFIYNLEDSIDVEQITEEYNLNVKNTNF